ncbi:MAG: hypothetical protein AAFX81_18505, partial [Pseudomonadota bacterium]
ELGQGHDRVKLVDEDEPAYVPTPVPGSGLMADGTPHPVRLVGVEVPGGLTLEGELNKLAWNVANARNIAGVRYFTDYVESIILGEDITLGILREQMHTYQAAENVTMTVPLFVERTLPAALGADQLGPCRVVRLERNGSISKIS